jgi:energy-coupled thiamine transporter ThiT
MSFFLKSGTDGSYNLTMAGYTGLVIIFVLILILGNMIFGKNKKSSPKKLAFSGVAIAIATLLSMVEIIHMPMGGSVTLFSMLFIVLIGWFYGLGSGLACAIAYGLLQLLIDPYILSLPQLLTDYILAFGALGLSGIFADKKHGLVKGYITGVLGRLFFSFLSGVIFFGTYAPKSVKFFGGKLPLNPYSYSFLYNGAYLFTEAALTIIIINIPPVRTALKKVKAMAQ